MQILSTLNLLNITSEFRTTAMLVITNWSPLSDEEDTVITALQTQITIISSLQRCFVR
jgi:hypothetical protein